MARYVTVQETITIEGDTTTATQNIQQAFANWIDTLDAADGCFLLQVAAITKAGSDTIDFSLRTCMEPDKSALTTDTGTAPGSATAIYTKSSITAGLVDKAWVYLDIGNTTGAMERFIFWNLKCNKVTGGPWRVVTGGPWRVTFRMTGVLKRAA